MAETDYTAWSDPALAAVYLEGVRGAIPLAKEQIDVMLRVIAAGRPVRRFLDLGCGDGVLAAAILERYPEAEATLLDFNQGMLDAAGRRFAGRPSVRFAGADYGDPGWTAAAGAPFDAIVSGFSIHHQPDARKRGIYREIYDLLEPGGVFVNVEHVASATPWVGAVNDELYIDSLHRLHRRKTREEVASTYYRRPDKAANILALVEDQCEWLRDIGFTDVDCFFKIFETAVFGGRRP